MKKIITVLFILLSISVSSFAADLSTNDSGVLVFEGCVDVSNLKSDYYMNSSNRLSYMILKESDYDETKGIYLEHLSKALHIGQNNYSIDDGSYTINLKIKAETGNYKLLVYAPVIGTEVYDLTHTSYYFNEFNDAIDEQSSDLMSSFIDSYKTALGIDTIALSYLENTGRVSYIDELLALGKATSNNDLISKIKQIDIRNVLFSNASSDALNAYIVAVSKDEEHEFNHPIICYYADKAKEEEYSDITNVVEKYVGDVLPDDFYDDFSYEIFKCLKQKFDYFAQWEQIIKEEDNSFGFSAEYIEKYNNTSDTKGILKSFSAKLTEIEDIADVRAAFVYAVDNPVKESAPSGTGGGSGGGGGGSRPSGGSKGSVSVTVPDITPNATIPVVNDVKKFSDMEGFEWAENAVNILRAEGIINGVSEDKYEPASSVTREQFVKMLTSGLRMTGIEADFEYSDVKPEDWFYNAVGAAARAGIVKGNSDGTFGVGTFITREDMAVMLSRALDCKQLMLKQEITSQFEDENEISEYAVQAVKKLADSGIINGDGVNFMPKKSLTRAEAAKALYEFFVKTDIIR